jgi:TetR/AcrR family transcriptional regulator
MQDILKNMDEEKRVRVINSAIEEFSLYPFEKASTNNIVKNAGISKGLLFHYFGNKKELYDKLIEFVINNIFTEVEQGTDWNETDIFERMKQIVLLKMDISRKYPHMFDFILKVLKNNTNYTVEEIMNFYQKYGVNINEIMQRVYTENIAFDNFKEPAIMDKSMNIIRWTMEKYAEEKLAQFDGFSRNNFDDMAKGIDEYIEVLKKAFY